MHRPKSSRSFRFLPTRVHGVLDYLMGLLLIIGPWLFGFAAGGPETWVPVILGASVILYSLFTNYELGVIRRLDMTVHLGLDAMGGSILALSPAIFRFSEDVWVPHVVLGILEVCAALSTRTKPSPAMRPAHEMV